MGYGALDTKDTVVWSSRRLNHIPHWPLAAETVKPTAVIKNLSLPAVPSPVPVVLDQRHNNACCPVVLITLRNVPSPFHTFVCRHVARPVVIIMLWTAQSLIHTFVVSLACPVVLSFFRQTQIESNIGLLFEISNRIE